MTGAPQSNDWWEVVGAQGLCGQRGTGCHSLRICRYVKYAMDTRMSLTDTALCTDSTRTRVDVDSELRARKADCDRVN